MLPLHTAASVHTMKKALPSKVGMSDPLKAAGAQHTPVQRLYIALTYATVGCRPV